MSRTLQTTVQHGVCTSQVIKAEIIWCFRTVLIDSSNSSNEDISATFRLFPDDKNLVNFGITLWIKELLRDDVEIAARVVIGFDESLNKATQTCQMDVNVDVNDEDYQPISERK